MVDQLQALTIVDAFRSLSSSPTHLSQMDVMSSSYTIQLQSTNHCWDNCESPRIPYPRWFQLRISLYNQPASRPHRKEIGASYLMVLMAKSVCGGIGARAQGPLRLQDQGYIQVASVATNSSTTLCYGFGTLWGYFLQDLAKTHPQQQPPSSSIACANTAGAVIAWESDLG